MISVPKIVTTEGIITKLKDVVVPAQILTVTIINTDTQKDIELTPSQKRIVSNSNKENA